MTATPSQHPTPKRETHAAKAPLPTIPRGTLWRRLGRLARRGGRLVAEAGPRAAVDSWRQSHGARTIGLWPGTTMVSHHRQARATHLDDHSVLIRRTGDGAPASNEWLVTSKGVTPIAGPKALMDLVATRNIVQVLRQYQVNCVLDVGANAGQYATGLREAGWKGRIVSFEPVPDIFRQLAAAAKGDSSWHVKNMALGREDGELTINVVAGQGFATSLLPPSEFGARRRPKLTTTTPLQVQVRRLGPLLAELLAGIDEPRVYLKLDTQGFDLEVFAGLGDQLDLIVAMQSEVSQLSIYEGMPDLLASLGTYRSHGFDLAGCWPVAYERSTYRVTEFDAVMVRRPSES